MKKIVLVFVPLLVIACSSAPNKDSSQGAQSGTSSAAGKSNSGAGSASANNSDIESGKLAAEMRELQKQSIYFDFDEYAIKQEYKKVIQQQADFTKAHKNDIVTIDGNADERGSDEYNLALGGRRANAAQKNLELLGVPAKQIKTLSLGSEKPRLSCHEEKCWQENRRDDFSHKLN